MENIKNFLPDWKKPFGARIYNGMLHLMSGGGDNYQIKVTSLSQAEGIVMHLQWMKTHQWINWVEKNGGKYLTYEEIFQAYKSFMPSSSNTPETPHSKSSGSYQGNPHTS